MKRVAIRKEIPPNVETIGVNIKPYRKDFHVVKSELSPFAKKSLTRPTM